MENKGKIPKRPSKESIMESIEIIAQEMVIIATFLLVAILRVF